MPDDAKFAKCACESCGGRIEFPVELDGTNIECPHCHFNTTLSRPGAKPPQAKSNLALTIGLPILALAVLAFGAWQFYLKRQLAPATMASEQPAGVLTSNQLKSNLVASVPPTNANPAPRPVVWHGLESGPVTIEKAHEGNLTYAVGKLRNTSDKEKFGVKVIVNLFDESGARLGSASDYASSIEAGKEWRFRALVVDHGAVKGEISDVTEN